MTGSSNFFGCLMLCRSSFVQINKNEPVLMSAGAAYKVCGLKLLFITVLILHSLLFSVGSSFACADDCCFPSKLYCQSSNQLFTFVPPLG